MSENVKSYDNDIRRLIDTMGKLTSQVSDSNEKVAEQDRKLKSAAGAAKNSTSAFAKNASGLGGLVHVYATFAANVFAVSAAFGVLKNAANFTNLEKSIETFSRTTGLNMRNIAEDMKRVAQGAINLQTSFALANRAVSAGISGENLSKLTEIATKAAVKGGRDVEDSINRMVNAVIKGEPELVDELGIILRLGEAADAYAKSLGKTAKELTTAERQQAVLNQALERGAIATRGVNIEDAANPFAQLSTAALEAGRDIAAVIASVLGPAINVIKDNALLISSLILGIGSSLVRKALPSFTEFSKGLQESFKNSTDTITKLKKDADTLVLKKDTGVVPISPAKTISIIKRVAQEAGTAFQTEFTKSLGSGGSGKTAREFQAAFTDALVSSSAGRSVELQLTNMGNILETTTSKTVKLFNTEIPRKYAREILAVQGEYQTLGTRARLVMDDIAVRSQIAVDKVKIGLAGVRASFGAGLEAGFADATTGKLSERIDAAKRSVEAVNGKLGVMSNLVLYTASGVSAIIANFGKFVNIASIALVAWQLLGGLISTIAEKLGLWSEAADKANDALKEYSKSMKTVLSDTKQVQIDTSKLFTSEKASTQEIIALLQKKINIQKEGLNATKAAAKESVNLANTEGVFTSLTPSKESLSIAIKAIEQIGGTEKSFLETRLQLDKDSALASEKRLINSRKHVSAYKEAQQALEGMGGEYISIDRLSTKNNDTLLKTDVTLKDILLSEEKRAKLGLSLGDAYSIALDRATKLYAKLTGINETTGVSPLQNIEAQFNDITAKASNIGTTLGDTMKSLTNSSPLGKLTGQLTDAYDLIQKTREEINKLPVGAGKEDQLKGLENVVNNQLKDTVDLLYTQNELNGAIGTEAKLKELSGVYTERNTTIATATLVGQKKSFEVTRMQADLDAKRTRDVAALAGAQAAVVQQQIKVLDASIADERAKIKQNVANKENIALLTAQLEANIQNRNTLAAQLSEYSAINVQIKQNNVLAEDTVTTSGARLNVLEQQVEMHKLLAKTESLSASERAKHSKDALSAQISLYDASISSMEAQRSMARENAASLAKAGQGNLATGVGTKLFEDEITKVRDLNIKIIKERASREDAITELATSGVESRTKLYKQEQEAELERNKLLEGYISLLGNARSLEDTSGKAKLDYLSREMALTKANASVRVKAAESEIALHRENISELEKQQNHNIVGSQVYLQLQKETTAIYEAELELLNAQTESRKSLLELERERVDLALHTTKASPFSEEGAKAVGDKLAQVSNDFVRKMQSSAELMANAISGAIDGGVDSFVDSLSEGSIGDAFKSALTGALEGAKSIVDENTKNVLKGALNGIASKAFGKDNFLGIQRSDTEILSSIDANIAKIAGTSALDISSPSNFINSAAQSVAGDITDSGSSISSGFDNLISILDRGTFGLAGVLSDAVVGIGKSIGGLFSSSSSDSGTSGIVASAAASLFSGMSFFANGSPIVNKPTIGMVGEGTMPEAIVPLPDGRSIPVQFNGGTSDNVVVNVSVNVSDSSASASSDGTGKAGQLGSMIAAAIKQQLINEKRPGGLLAK